MHTPSNFWNDVHGFCSKQLQNYDMTYDLVKMCTNIVNEKQVSLPIVYYCHLDHIASSQYEQLMITAMKVRDANHIIQSSRQALNMKNVMNVSSIDQILYF